MSNHLRVGLEAFTFTVLAYFFILNTIYLVLVVLAARDAARYFRRLPFVGFEDVVTSPLTPAVSIIVPSHNEEAGIVDSVKSMLSLRYNDFEVVVVEDGSTDNTFAVLKEAFGLVQVPRVIPDDIPTEGRIYATYQAKKDPSLIVVRKVGAGKKTDANNAGINAARNPLVCLVDADSVLDDEALLRVVKPYVDEPERMVATGGSIRVANGSTIINGRVLAPIMPKGWLARVQVVEYLRAFLLGRAGWSHLEGLLIVSGAFGMFRRETLVDVGGFDPDCIGEDAELVARIHRRCREEKRDYIVQFVPEPVCWTEVPTTLESLGSQRRRWSRGLAETLWTHRAMIGNPRYGRIGLVVMPYYLLFECLGPVVELLGLIITPIAVVLGLLYVKYAIVLAVFSIGYAMLLSIASIAVEEFSYHRYARGKDLWIAIAAALWENLGYRQIHSWWRLQGLWQFLRGSKSHWQNFEREGLSSSKAA